MEVKVILRYSINGEGIFPNKSIDSTEKLKYGKELNNRDFYSSLNYENIL